MGSRPQRRSEAEAGGAAGAAPQLSKHAEWSKHEHKMPEDGLLKVVLLPPQRDLHHQSALRIFRVAPSIDEIHVDLQCNSSANK